MSASVQAGTALSRVKDEERIQAWGRWQRFKTKVMERQGSRDTVSPRAPYLSVDYRVTMAGVRVA